MYVQLTMAERLKDLRVIDKKLTLEQLAEQTGLSKSALGKYENEDCGDINHYAIQKLAKFYGVSTDYLLGLTEQKNHSDVDVASLHLSDEVLELPLCDWLAGIPAQHHHHARSGTAGAAPCVFQNCGCDGCGRQRRPLQGLNA